MYVPPVSELKSGKANLTPTTLEKLALGLDVEVFDLVSFTHAGPTPAKVRNRLKTLVDATDDQTLQALYDAMLMMVRL